MKYFYADYTGLLTDKKFKKSDAVFYCEALI